MREILFRGKRVDNGEWEQGDLDRGLFANIDFISYFKNIGERVSYEIIPETVGQYTGLTDKNGKRIFEGDIIKATGLPKTKKDYILGTVVFENGTFKLSVFGNVKNGEFSFIYSSYDDDKKTSKYAIENNFIFRGYYLEVIGNIHDNPELLKGSDS